jgi:phage-related protein
MKPVTWLGDSRQAVKDFPQIARQRTKKARRTPKPDIDLARARFSALVNERKKK